MSSPAWKSIRMNFESLKRDNSQVNNTSYYWYRSRTSGHEYCLHFDDSSPPWELIYDSLKSAKLLNSKSKAIHIFCDGHIEECPWREYMEPPFEASGLPTIAHTNLVVSKTIHRGVDIVQVQGDTVFYVHKYMTPYSSPTSFNIELNNYIKVRDSPYVPDLVAVVRKDHQNRGLLLSAIDGDDLSKFTGTVNERWSITAKLLDALVHLETLSYFPQDLKPENIMLRHVDESLVIIDLGDGRTEGYYRDRSSSNRIEERRMAPAGEFKSSESFYTIGRTLWALWSDDPHCFNCDDPPNTIPLLIRDLIHHCCNTEKFNSVQELYEAYSDAVKNMSENIGAGIAFPLAVE